MITNSKRMLAIIVALVLMVPFLPFRGAAIVQDSGSDSSFYAPALEKMIQNNLATQSADSVFSNTLANAYLVDCDKLFSILSDLSSEELIFVAKAIAYDLNVTSRVSSAIQPSTYFGTDYFAVAELIYNEAQNSENANFVNTMVEQELQITETLLNPDIMLLTDEEVYGITLSLSDNDIDIYDLLNVSVSFTTNLVGSAERNYRIELYITDGVSHTLLRRGFATISAGYVNTTATIPATINTTGQYSLYAKILSSSGELMATSSGCTVTVRGQWHVDVALPTDRNYLGTLTLYNAAGTQILQDICLGKSESGASMLTYHGNTPTGEYTGHLMVHNDSTYSYGPYMVIATNPVSGVIVESGRDGIWIHGGDPNTNTNSNHYPLRVTYGCVRVTNATQLALQNSITNLVQQMYHYEWGTITIRETA